MDSTRDPSRTKLSRLSDRLLASLRRMRQLELEKRRAVISTPRFHALADEIEAEGREVFKLSDAEEEAGDQAERRGDSIEDVARSSRR